MKYVSSVVRILNTTQRNEIPINKNPNVYIDIDL